MLGKFLLPLRTAIALKSNNAIRVSESYQQSQKIGILYTYKQESDLQRVNDFMDNLEKEGKKVVAIAFISQYNILEEYRFTHFCLKDIDVLGNWNKPEVSDFCKEPFDYLINLDLSASRITENIFATSKAKCRVGRFEEGKNDFFELMIDQKEDKPKEFIKQIHYYIKNVRNG